MKPVREQPMATYVLVHGLGAGGWCWRDVAARLRSNGHSVFTPSLTGLAERSHLAGPNVDLDTHIQDIENVLVWEQLNNVILVGHSYGGSVVTGAADRSSDRIRRLVYLDAFVLRHGESVLSLQPPERARHYERIAREQGEGWRIPPNTAAFYGVEDPAQQQWIDALSVDQPFATLRQAITLKHCDKTPFPRSYVWAPGFTPSPFERFARRVQSDPDWDFREIEGSHMMMVTHPQQTADVLEQFAEI